MLQLEDRGLKLGGLAAKAASVHLTDAVNGQGGSFIVDDLLNGGRLGSFELNFSARVTWTTIGTVKADKDGYVLLSDPGAAGKAMRFYRVVEPQP